MTVTTSSSIGQATATIEGQTEFVFNQVSIIDSTDVTVSVNDSEVGSSSYTVTENTSPSTGITIIFDTGLSVDDEVVVVRDIPPTRAADFSAGGNISPDLLDSQLDKITMLIQQFRDLLTQRGLQYPSEAYVASGLNLLPVPNASQFLKSNTTGNGLLWVTLEESGGYSALRSELADDESGTDGARLIGYNSPKNGRTTLKNELDYIYNEFANHIQTGFIIHGQVLPSLAGWVILNDGTIGSSGSSATTRANDDTYNLFAFLWDNLSQDLCPVPSGRGSTALEDFEANKVITLPPFAGRTLGVKGQHGYRIDFTADDSTDVLTVESNQILMTGVPVTLTTTGTLPAPLATSTTYYVVRLNGTTLKLATSIENAQDGTVIDITDTGTGTHTIYHTSNTKAFGLFQGAENVAITKAQMAKHTHTYDKIRSNVDSHGGGGTVNIPNGFDSINTGDGAPSGLGGELINLYQPTIYYNSFIKL